MSDYTAAENAVIKNFFKFDMTDFGDEAEPPEIRSTLIRKLVLGRLKPKSEQRKGPFSYPGFLHIKKARITGAIELNHNASPLGGEPMALILEDCVIESEVNLAHSKFRFLSFKNSQVPAIRAHGARITGDLDATGIRGLDTQKSAEVKFAPCVLDFSHMQLGGSFLAGGARLYQPEHVNQSAFFSTEAMALHLGHAHIGGDLILQNDFQCTGELNLHHARIGGDFRGRGMRVFNPGKVAILAQHMELGGTFFIGSTPPSGSKEPPSEYPCLVNGTLWFYQASIGGDCAIQGALITETPDEGAICLIASRIKGGIWLSSAEGVKPEQRIPLTLHGRIDLSGCRVEKNIYIETVKTNAQKGGKPIISMPDADIKGELWMNAVSVDPQEALAAIDGRVVRIAKGAYINFDESLQNVSVNLRGAQIDHTIHISGYGQFQLNDARISGGLLYEAREDAGLTAPNAQVGADVTLRGSGRIQLPNSSIGGKLIVQGQTNTDVHADGSRITGVAIISGDFAQSDDSRPAVSLRDCEFQSRLELMKIGIVRNDVALNNKETNVISDGDQRIAEGLDLDGARVLHALRVGDIRSKIRTKQHPPWLERGPVKSISCRLSFYPNWKLYEYLFDDEENENLRTSSWLVHEPLQNSAPVYQVSESQYFRDKRNSNTEMVINEDMPGLILLSGESAPLHAMNERYLDLTDSTVIDYLLFFCSMVWGDEGPFTIIRSREQLEQAGFSKEFIESKFPNTSYEIKKTGNNWIYNTLILYGRGLFRATLEVHPDGTVEMTDDDPIGVLETEGKIIYDSPPFRILPYEHFKEITSDSPRHLLFNMAQFSGNPEEAKNELPSKVDEELKKRTVSGYKSSEGGKSRVSFKHMRADIFHFQMSRDKKEICDINDIIYDFRGFTYNHIPDIIRENPISTRAVSDMKRAFESATGEAESPPAEQFLDLLSLQYRDRKKPSAGEYEPQPYEQLSRVMLKEGLVEISQDILLKKLRLDNKFKQVPEWARVIPKPFFWSVDRLFKLKGYLFDLCFSYGLRSRRSLLTLLIVYMAGCLFAYYAIETKNMVVNTQPVLQSNTDRFFIDSVLSQVVPDFSTEPRYNFAEHACENLVDPFLYSLDTMVPLLDIQQETKCVISARPGAFLWRMGKALLSILGGIATAMVILSLSGSIRRNIER